MPNLIQSFQRRDIGFLRIVARLWGIELTASDVEKVLDEITSAMLDQTLFRDMVDSLPAEARSAFEALVFAEGKLSWASFSRQFGEIRETGPGRRDREQIYLNPASPAEVLFYRGLIAKAFFDVPAGAQEFAYIPSDFLHLINRGEQSSFLEAKIVGTSGDQNSTSTNHAVSTGLTELLGRQASSKECACFLSTSDRLLDDATTILAAFRMRRPLPDTRIPALVVLDFLSAAKIIQLSSHKERPGEGTPYIEAVRRFLQTSRKNSLEMLLTGWLGSESFNELRQIPGLICEGEWNNRALDTRRYLLTLLEAVPENKWWSLPAFVNSIKEKNPDFQRPAGDYDSWFIKRESDGEYLRGFAYWNEVDGALVRYMITGPMYWLGLVELATPADSGIISAFRLKNRKSRMAVPESGKIHVSSQGRIVVPRLLSRLIRYQIARFCEWDSEKENDYQYRISTASLKSAKEQGLKVNQLLSLLARNAAAEVPPAFIKALKRWELNGTEACLEIHTILKVSRPEILEELRKSKAGRFLGETLGPVTVTVKSGAQPKVLAALVELGVLGEEVHEE
ncbi:MAG: helicase-associated domain-containing protein [Anaerolineales bacterium]|jgi:hypothetical protein